MFILEDFFKRRSLTQLDVSWHNRVGWPAASQQRATSSWRLARCELQLALLLGKFNSTTPCTSLPSPPPNGP